MRRTDISFLSINLSNKRPRDHVMIRRELWLVQFLYGFTDRNQLLHQIDILATKIWLKQSKVTDKHYFLKLFCAHISKRQSGICKVIMWTCLTCIFIYLFITYLFFYILGFFVCFVLGGFLGGGVWSVFNNL